MCGAGYDAYVVVGTAPKALTLKDESLMECPFSMDIQDNEDRDDPEIDEDENSSKPDIKPAHRPDETVKLINTQKMVLK